MDPTTLTLKDASEKIPDAGADWLQSNKQYYDGDHWQDGKGWSGPILPSTHDLYNQIFLEIRRAFVSKNTVAEVIERHVAGVIGREPGWSLAVRRSLAEGEEPSLEEQLLIDEAEALLTEWWDEREIHNTLQEAAASCLWAKRGALRLFVPPGLLVDGFVPVADLPGSLNKIYVHHPDPDQATVFLDRGTMQSLGVYLYAEGKDQFAELTYLDPLTGQTIIRIVSNKEDKEEAEPIFDLALGGRLTIYEMQRKRLITDQVTQNQKLLNLALTMLQRNVVQAGFLERTFFNAQLPGRTVQDPDSPGGTKWVPEPLHVGAGATNFLSGVTTEDAEGNQTLASPSVVYRDPVPVTVFRDTKEEAYRNILEETRQQHALISGDAAASGESRKQALTDFEQSLADTKSDLEAAIRWLLETALAMAAVFSGQPGRYEALRVNAECRVELGPVSADDQRVAKELSEASIISRETAMARVGIDDVDAEAAKIAIEKDADSQRQQQTLAAAVLNAQRQLDSGAGSNGLEQPAPEGNQDETITTQE